MARPRKTEQVSTSVEVAPVVEVHVPDEILSPQTLREMEAGRATLERLRAAVPAPELQGRQYVTQTVILTLEPAPGSELQPDPTPDPTAPTE